MFRLELDFVLRRSFFPYALCLTGISCASTASVPMHDDAWSLNVARALVAELEEAQPNATIHVDPRSLRTVPIPSDVKEEFLVSETDTLLDRRRRVIAADGLLEGDVFFEIQCEGMFGFDGLRLDTDPPLPDSLKAIADGCIDRGNQIVVILSHPRPWSDANRQMAIRAFAVGDDAFRSWDVIVDEDGNVEDVRLLQYLQS